MHGPQKADVLGQSQIRNATDFGESFRRLVSRPVVDHDDAVRRGNGGHHQRAQTGGRRTPVVVDRNNDDDFDGARVAKADSPGVALDPSDHFDVGTHAVGHRPVTVPPTHAQGQDANHNAKKDSEAQRVSRQKSSHDAGFLAARGVQFGGKSLTQEVA